MLTALPGKAMRVFGNRTLTRFPNETLFVRGCQASGAANAGLVLAIIADADAASAHPLAEIAMAIDSVRLPSVTS